MNKTVETRTPIVAIGSSAGGLEALKEFFEYVPSDCNAAFIVVQHLGKAFSSNLDKLLSKVTTRKILLAQDGALVQPNTIYLQPQGHTITLSGDRIQLQEIDNSNILQFPINTLFEAIAKLDDRRLAAAVLSGTGSDGARALSHLQDAGALTIAQDVETAEFSGMPQTAINTDNIDLVLAPRDMGIAIQRFITRDKDLVQTPEQIEQSCIDQIYQMLLLQTGVDFKVYKQTTLLRRIDRRMGIRQVDELTDYLEIIVNDRQELAWLSRDLLIGVTNFFRDTESFASLNRIVRERLVNEWSEKQQIRIWVTCCSTGQEIYSIGIMMLEAIEDLGLQKEIKIFATDVEPEAIKAASAGIYTDVEVENMPPYLLSKYFRATHEGWQVSRRLRERVVVASHNLIKDPPFSALDLVTCRHMMIYLMHDAQRRALTALHFSMARDGILMLGRAENPREVEHCFQTLDEKSKIYTNLDVGRLPLESMVVPKPGKLKKRDIMVTPRDTDENRLIKEMALTFLGDFTPPCVLLDEQENIRHVFGDISPFTQPLKPGRFSPNMSNMVHQDLSVAVFTALKRCKEEGKEIHYRNVVMQSESRNVHIRVLPYIDRGTNHRLFLILFETNDDENVAYNSSNTINFDEIELARERIQHLEAEVQRQGESLQVTVEELETTNEELQASKEELTVANEELQSTNEELQSVNEELYSVNAEYEENIRELSEVNSSLDQIMRSAAIGILMLDELGQVQSFTESVTLFVRLIDSDVGRPLSDIRHSLDYPDMMADVNATLQGGESNERLATGINGQPVLVRVNGYGEDPASGVVMTFTPIKASGVIAEK